MCSTLIVGNVQQLSLVTVLLVSKMKRAFYNELSYLVQRIPIHYVIIIGRVMDVHIEMKAKKDISFTAP